MSAQPTTPENPPTGKIQEELRQRIPEDWGREIHTEPGWNWILTDIHHKLHYMDPDYAIVQIKEKFGTLRFYFSSTHPNKTVIDIMEDIASRGETQSASTCETCGNSSTRVPPHGKIDSTVALHTHGGHLKTLCAPCAAQQHYVPVDPA